MFWGCNGNLIHVGAIAEELRKSSAHPLLCRFTTKFKPYTYTEHVRMFCKNKFLFSIKQIIIVLKMKDAVIICQESRSQHLNA